MKDEEKVIIPIDNEFINGMFSLQSEEAGVLISHPHPQLGGDMDNNVILAIRDAFLSLGYSTLRFNFRKPVSVSEDKMESEFYVNDLKTAYSWLSVKSCKQIILAGYSFGAWISSIACLKIENLHSVLLIAPPISFFDFNSLKDIDSCTNIIYGENDSFCPENKISKEKSKTSGMSKYYAIKESDHFFIGYESEIFKIIQTIYKKTG